MKSHCREISDQGPRAREVTPNETEDDATDSNNLSVSANCSSLRSLARVIKLPLVRNKFDALARLT
jgi:hypothetical protein